MIVDWLNDNREGTGGSLTDAPSVTRETVEEESVEEVSLITEATFVWEEGWSSVIVYTAVGLYQIAKSKIFKVWFLTTIDCHYYSKL